MLKQIGQMSVEPADVAGPRPDTVHEEQRAGNNLPRKVPGSLPPQSSPILCSCLTVRR